MLSDPDTNLSGGGAALATEATGTPLGGGVDGGGGSGSEAGGGESAAALDGPAAASRVTDAPLR